MYFLGGFEGNSQEVSGRKHVGGRVYLSQGYFLHVLYVLMF